MTITNVCRIIGMSMCGAGVEATAPVIVYLVVYHSWNDRQVIDEGRGKAVILPYAGAMVRF